MRDQNRNLISRLATKIKNVFSRSSNRGHPLEEVIVQFNDANTNNLQNNPQPFQAPPPIALNIPAPPPAPPFVPANNQVPPVAPEVNVALGNNIDVDLKKSLINYSEKAFLAVSAVSFLAYNLVKNTNAIAPLMFLPGLIGGFSAGGAFAKGDKGLAALEFAVAMGTTSLCLGVGIIPAFALTIVAASIGYIFTQFIDNRHKDDQPQNPVQIA